jgi:hypothetical protein
MCRVARRLKFRLEELQEEGFQKCDGPVKVIVLSKKEVNFLRFNVLFIGGLISVGHSSLLMSTRDGIFKL